MAGWAKIVGKPVRSDVESLLERVAESYCWKTAALSFVMIRG
jgi:hypothetical protein